MSYTLSTDISDKLLELYLAEPVIAIDTELHGLRLYRDEVCLVQICDDKKNVCLVKPEHKQVPPNLKKLLTDKNVIKVFHFALSDVAFFKTSMNIEVSPFRCTKVMSKLIRTYTQGHGLKDLSQELLGHDLNKDQQQTNWAHNNLSSKQLEYAANDVLELVQIYRKLTDMMLNRPPLSTGTTVNELNIKAQAMLPSLIDLLVHGYGDKNGGWESSLFTH
jgi:ribonuclease D